MGLKSELQATVRETFRGGWTERDGTVVPDADSVKLGNDGVNLDAVVLYADLSDSTLLVKNETKTFAAEVYKTFLHCAAKIIKAESGTIMAYDGDRIMAVFIEGAKNTAAVRAALKINWAVKNIIRTEQKDFYTSKSFQLNHVVGIDSSKLLVANTGVRGAKDLVWVGNAANIAAKLASLPHSYPTYITDRVYGLILDEVKFTNGQAMWEERKWSGYDSSTIYGSTWSWPLV